MVYHCLGKIFKQSVILEMFLCKLWIVPYNNEMSKFSFKISFFETPKPSHYYALINEFKDRTIEVESCINANRLE